MNHNILGKIYSKIEMSHAIYEILVFRNSKNPDRYYFYEESEAHKYKRDMYIKHLPKYPQYLDKLEGVLKEINDEGKDKELREKCLSDTRVEILCDKLIEIENKKGFFMDVVGIVYMSVHKIYVK